MAPLHGGKVSASGKQVGHKVTLVNETIAGVPHRRILAEHMEDLGPGTFGGVVIPALAYIVRLVARACGRKLFRLGSPGMVLPEDEHCIRVFGKSGKHGQRHSAAVGHANGASGSIYGDGTNCLWIGTGGYYRIEHFLQALDVIQWTSIP